MMYKPAEMKWVYLKWSITYWWLILIANIFFKLKNQPINQLPVANWDNYMLPNITQFSQPEDGWKKFKQNEIDQLFKA
jgi:hypothetical protein